MVVKKRESKTKKNVKRKSNKIVKKIIKKTVKAKTKKSDKSRKITKKSASPSPSQKRMPAKEKNNLKKMLMMLRDKLNNQVSVLRDESLNKNDLIDMAEDGTGAFNRQFAMDLAFSESDLLFEINEALKRIDNRTYGICVDCGKLIEKSRLKALPFAKRCISCKSKFEKNPHNAIQ